MNYFPWDECWPAQGGAFDGGPGEGHAAFEAIARDVGVERRAIEPAEVYGDAEDPQDLVVERGSGDVSVLQQGDLLGPW